MSEGSFGSDFYTVNGVTQRRKDYSLSEREYHDKLTARGHYEDGSEAPDPMPMEPPLGFVRQPTMVEHIRNMVRSEHLRLAAVKEGAETFEEADDFDVADELEPASAYEFDEAFEPEPAQPADPEPLAAGGGSVNAPQPKGVGEPKGDADAGLTRSPQPAAKS